jgi:hypothetical protein
LFIPAEGFDDVGDIEDPLKSISKSAIQEFKVEPFFALIKEFAGESSHAAKISLISITANIESLRVYFASIGAGSQSFSKNQYPPINISID